jgi:transposase
VRLVRATGKPIAQVARDLGINEGTLGDWGQRGQAPPRRWESGAG